MKNTTQKNKTDKSLKMSLNLLKLNNPKMRIIAIGASVTLLILVALYFTKGLFIAATVNGMPISRLSVIKELENQQGKRALEFIINEKLIDTELSKQKEGVTPAEIDEEIKKIETGLASQGETLDAVLAEKGLTKEKVREQIVTQKKIEKLLADKLAVTDSEIETYIKDSKLTPPKDVKIEDFRKQISEQLKQQKFQEEAQKWASELTKNAKIKYYVSY